MTALLKPDDVASDDTKVLSAELNYKVFQTITLPAIIFKVDSESKYNIVGTNAAFENCFNCSGKKLYGKNISSLEPFISEEGVRTLCRNIPKCIEQASALCFYEILSVKRKRYHSHITLSPIINNQKETTHILFVQEFGNELKAAEAEVTKLKISYERQVKEKTETLILTNKNLRETAKENKELKQEFFSISKNFLSLLRSVPGFLYVVDPDTYEILIMRDDLIPGLSGGINEMKCYQRIYGLNNPCGFCKNENIEKQKSLVAAINHSEKIITQIIKWIDGRDVWLRREINTK